MGKKKQVHVQTKVQTSHDPTTEDIYCEAIDEAGERLLKAMRDLKEERAKNEVLRRLMDEMKNKMGEAESRVKIYEKVQKERSINKDKITNKISRIFEKRDENDEKEIKDMMSKYEEELRREYRI